ncbi:GGDEF domain-containing protein [Vibrio sp.]|uniref:GGDEF domain-containing protein n=1 Tax=Vibrio sp. TaxID=678 RepID=UPI003D0AD6AE
MSINAHNFIVDKLAEVVKDKQRRQRMMVNAITVFGLVFLVVFCVNSFLKGEQMLGSILAVFSGLAVCNVYVMNRWRTAGLIGLTTIIYSLGVILTVTGGYQSTGILWVYPLVAIAIFINPFQIGLLLNALFLLILTWVMFFSPYQQLSEALYTDVFAVRVVITLIGLAGMCHILIYFQSKADEYIIKMHEEDVVKLAYFDSLTMLSNRVTFRSILYHSIQRHNFPVSAIIYIDLDNFKDINDDYGHDCGDKVLADFGKQLRQVALRNLGNDLGPYDVGRLGGDEFAIFIADAEDKVRVERLAKHVLAIFAEHQLESLKGLKHQMGVSLGVVFVDNEKADLIESISVADRAMYQAKQAGKGRITIVNGSVANATA